MTWSKDANARRRDAQVYGPAYRLARAQARTRANGRCEQCGHRHPRLECDHITPTTQGGSHDLANLQLLCAGVQSCRCHERKTAQEGGGGGRVIVDPEPKVRTNW